MRLTIARRATNAILGGTRQQRITLPLASTSPTPGAVVLPTTRGYRGDTGEAMPTLSTEEERLIAIARPKADEIFARHIRLPQDGDVNVNENALDIRRKRLIYRSKQRGWLEVDLLLGTWASEFVPTLQGEELDQYEDFVNMETIDIYNIITLRLDVPTSFQRPDGQGVVQRIQEWARSSPLGKADPETYKAVKAEAKLI